MRRRDLLAGASAIALATGLPARVRARSGARKFILVWVNGGWDTTYCMDPKLGSPNVDGPEDEPVNPDAPPSVEEVRTFGDNLQILCNDAARPNVTSFFEKWASKVAVVNGLQVGSIGHDPARYRMLTGTSDARNPDLSVMIGQALGASLPLGSIDFSGYSLTGNYAASNGRIGARSQLENLLDPTACLQPPAELGLPPYPLHVPSPGDTEAAQALVLARMERYLASRGLESESKRRIEQYFESQDRVARFRELAGGILASLETGKVPGFGDSLGLAIDLFVQGVCQTALIDSGLAWDSHSDNTTQSNRYNDLFGGLDQLLTRVYEPSVDETPLGDEVTIAVLSEFTRTPRFNLDGGKDHWPVGSALLIGDGVRGGLAFGGTTDGLGEQRVDLDTGEVTDSGEYLGYDKFAAGILELCGVDPGDWLPGVAPFRAPAV